jgi:hypothetical protein
MEQQLESVEKYKIPSSKTIENAAHIFVSMVPEEEQKVPTTF